MERHAALIIFILAFGCVELISGSAYAQVDPTSSLLLRRTQKDVQDESLDSGRYTVRPKKDEERESVEPDQIIKKPESSFPQKTVKPDLKEAAEPIRTLVGEKTVPLEEDQGLDPRQFSKQMREMFLGGEDQTIEKYKGLLHPWDSRNNIVEIGVAPTYIYSDSQSSYWFRNYITQSPGITAYGSLWVTPFFGLRGEYISNLSGGVLANPTDNEVIKAEEQWYNFGVRVRRFHGLSRKAKSLTFGFDYHEYQFRIPKDAANRTGLQSVGPRFTLEATLPKSFHFSWLLGVEMIPRMKHVEDDTVLNLKSGNKAETNLVGIWFGGKHHFDRKRQMYWKFSHSIEKTYYNGQSNVPDPKTGIAPKGVTILRGTSMFQLGLTWGN